MKDLFGEVGQKLELLPRPVQWWMRWFNALFLLAGVLAIWHVPARWALIAHLLCFPTGFMVYRYTRDVHLMGLPHLVFWTPLLVYLPTVIIRDPGLSIASSIGIWILLLVPTIAISLVFDVRAMFLYIKHLARTRRFGIEDSPD